MEIQINQDHIELSDKEREYLEEKISHLSHFAQQMNDESVKAQVHLQLDNTKTSNAHVNMEVTIHAPGAIIRSEVHATNVNEATDIAVEKLKKQVEKYKEKMHRRGNQGEWIPQSTLEGISDQSKTELDPVDARQILKRKKITDLNLMHEDEALHQMELLDHDFFIYKDKDSGKYCLLYRRHKGGYGSMELE